MKRCSESKRLNIIIQYITILLGAFIMAFGYAYFCIPFKIAPGGISGISTVLYYFTGIPVGMMTLGLSVPVFLFSIKILGIRFGIKTVFATVSFSFFIDSIAKIFHVFAGDIFIASIFGGVMIGIGLGIIFKTGASTGGTDLIAAMAKKYIPWISLGIWLLLIDSIVVLIAGVTFNSINVMLYSIITIYITNKMIDFILEGMDHTKVIYIISKKSDEIAQNILDILNRGVTSIYCKGMYSKKDMNMLMCIVSKTQISSVKKLVHDIDLNAFVLCVGALEVIGEGFKKIDV
jgi:uncharacterized membrane-anchored protein YitT (DUF2179 family)